MHTNSILWRMSLALTSLRRYGDAFLIRRSITARIVVEHDVYLFDQYSHYAGYYTMPRECQSSR